MAKTIIGKTAATMVALAAITAPTAVMAADNTTASPQSAVVENGIYFKGEVNKYYTIPELAGLTPQEKSDLLQKAGGLSNIVVVIDNQYSTLQEVSKTGKGNGGFYDVKKPLTKEDNFFEEGKKFTNSKGEPVPNPFDETPSEEAVAVESVKAINETTIEVTFGKDAATEETLVGKVLTLTDAEGNKLTATYSEKSLDKDGKAIFNLAKDQKLVDAAKYTVTGEGVTDAEFVAETTKAYVADFVKVTEAVPSNIGENGATSAVEIAVGGKDQYGKELSIAKLTKDDVTVKATVNGMALTATEAEFTNGVVKIADSVKLAEGDKLVLTLEHKATDKVTTKSTIEYTVQKAEAKKVSAIELVADETSVASGETITITAKTFDQFNSPAAVDKLRWVVNGKVVADETVKDGVLTLKETTPGDYKVEVFSTEDSKVKQQVTVTFGAAKLTDLTYKNDVKVKDEKVTVTKEDERFNHEELILGTVAPNPGAALSADNVKFHVEPGKDLTKEDIAVTAEEMEDKDGNKVIVVKATTTKPGTFTVTPFVGEEFTGEGVVKAGQFNITTKVNSEVATISDVTFDAKELKVGKDIYKEIVLKNKHGEVLTAKEADITPKSSNNDITATIEQGKKDIEGQDVNKTYLKVKAEKAGSAAITIQKGDVIKTVNVKFEAAKLAELKVASTKITGVVAGDEATKAKYNALTFLDQDGVKMTAPAKDAVTVKVTNAAGDVVTGENTDLVKLGEMKEVDGKVTFNGTTATHAQILPGSKLDKGTYTVTLSAKIDDKKTAEATFQVVVDAAREVTKVDLSTKSDKVVVNGTTDIMITPKDQYGELVKYANLEAAKQAITFKPSNANVKVGDLEKVTAGELDSSIKDQDEKAKVVGYKVTVTGVTKGSANVDVVVKGADKKEVKASQAITVDTTAALVDKVEIKEVEGVQNASSDKEVQLEAIVKDKNDTVVNVKPEELTWSIKGVKDAKGNALKVEAGADGVYTVTLPKEGENAAKTVKLNIDKNGKLTASESTLGELTVDVTVGVKTQNFKEAETTVTIGTADAAYKEGFKVAKITSGGKEVKFEGDGTEVEITDASKQITFTFTGVDQYGKEIVIDDLKAEGTVATSNKADLVATVGAYSKNVATTLTVEAKSLDGGEVYVSYKGTDMVIKVTVAGEAKAEIEKTLSEQKAVETAIAKLTANAVEVEDKSTAFIGDKSGALDVTPADAVAAMKAVVADEKVTIELSSVANAKAQTVTVKAGSVTQQAKVNLTVVPKKGNGQTLAFTGTKEQLQVMVNEGGTNKRYTLDELAKHEDANIKALAEKIQVENQTITIPTELLTTEQWTAIKTAEKSKILRAYRVTIVDNGTKIGKIAMYENGKAVIEAK